MRSAICFETKECVAQRLEWLSADRGPVVQSRPLQSARQSVCTGYWPQSCTQLQRLGVHRYVWMFIPANEQVVSAISVCMCVVTEWERKCLALWRNVRPRECYVQCVLISLGHFLKRRKRYKQPRGEETVSKCFSPISALLIIILQNEPAVNHSFMFTRNVTSTCDRITETVTEWGPKRFGLRLRSTVATVELTQVFLADVNMVPFHSDQRVRMLLWCLLAQWQGSATLNGTEPNKLN